MFKRVIVEDWATILPVVSFFIFFVVFAAITIRALRLGRKDRDRMASMPLDETTDTSQSRIP